MKKIKNSKIAKKRILTVARDENERRQIFIDQLQLADDELQFCRFLITVVYTPSDFNDIAPEV